MVILVYRVRTDAFEFPYPRELAGIYTEDMKEKLDAFVDNFNHKRISEWVPKLERQRSDMDVSSGIIDLNPPFESLCWTDVGPNDNVKPLSPT